MKYRIKYIRRADQKEQSYYLRPGETTAGPCFWLADDVKDAVMTDSLAHAEYIKNQFLKETTIPPDSEVLVEQIVSTTNYRNYYLTFRSLTSSSSGFVKLISVKGDGSIKFQVTKDIDLAQKLTESDVDYVLGICNEEGVTLGVRKIIEI